MQSVDPLPGQLGLAEGDFIVAIDGGAWWNARGTTPAGSGGRNPLFGLKKFKRTLTETRDARREIPFRTQIFDDISCCSSLEQL